MGRKVIAVWLSLAMVLGLIVIIDVSIDLTSNVGGTILYVNTTGTGGAYTSIQGAINDSKDGDTIFVYNGTYYENVTVNKTINLTGEDRNMTIIDGGGSGAAVLIKADWVNITGFTISNGGDGINIWSYSYNNITDNIFTMNDAHGLRLEESSNNSIMFNQFSDHMNYPMSFSSSSNNSIIGNYFSSTNDRGVHFISSLNNNFSNNTFINNGIFIRGETLSHFNSHTIPSSNTVNNKPILYYKDYNGLKIDGLSIGQLILANCTDFAVKNLHINNTYVGIELGYSSNIRITNNSLVSNVGDGIYLYSSSNNKITNNNMSNNGDGLRLFQLSNNNTIIDNDVFSNDWNGIYIKSSTYNNINKNNAIDNVFGIELSGFSNGNIIGNNVSSNTFSGIMLWGSSNNTISNNIGYDNEYGIRLLSSSHDNTIIGNNMYDSVYGIALEQSNNNMIMVNNVSNNFYGIIVGTPNNEIIGNDIMWNLLSGIEIFSSNNRIYHNNIIGNPTQAIDTTNNNNWDNGYPSGGNYWSDYIGVDNFKGPGQNISGSDGIGDTNYSIDLDSVDNYPLMRPYQNYTILKQGWNLISIPLIQMDQSLVTVLKNIYGSYDAVQWYDITDQNDPWKHYKVDKPYGNDLIQINETMGFWIHITQPGNTIFLYNGTQPTVNQTITLHQGWNLVGYPSLSNKNRTEALNNISFPYEVNSIWTYNAANQKWKEIGPTDYFEIGRGYWVHALTKCVWEVPL